MKHSIKREQSHARMSFAEFDNQRSLAEGESNVRATLKHMKLSFNLILTLALWLTMAQTAWAVELTKTFSFSTATVTNDYLSIKATDPDDNKQKAILTVNGTMMDVYLNSNPAFEIQNVTSAVSGQGNEVQLFISPYVDGKVTKVEFTKAGRSNQQGASTFSMSIDGMKYNGTDDALTGVGASGESTSFTFISTDAAGIAGNLTMRLGVDAKFFIDKSAGCEMIITYIPNVEPTHSHDFTFNAVGNTLTATCGHSDGLDCSLADANYQATLTLSPPVDTYYRPYTTYSAMHNLSGFNTATGLNATATDITYVNNTTGDNLGTAAPTTAGNYTASVTVTVGGTNYTLTTDFKVNTENSINNNIRQISLNKTNAANDEEITITFTPRSHELVNTLTVTGTTTNMSIGNGVTKVDEYTYTFLMPYEEVTIGATFKSSNTSLYKYTIGTDITGSGEVDYNAEEYLGAGDAITMTFMPYLQGNLEAGSVVLEGLTVTGTTTNMSVGNGITDNGDNTYTFTMPGENVTVTAKAYLSADAILSGTINEPIYIKQGNGIQIGCNNKWTYVNDGALPLVIPDGNTLRLAGGTDVRLNLADKNAIACEGDAIVELIPNEVANEIWIGDQYDRNSGKATIKVGPAGKTLTIRVADESIETVHLTVKSISQYDRNCDVIGCDEGGSCGSIVVESGQVDSREYYNHSGRAFRTTDGTITFGYKYPDDKIIFDGGSEGTVKIEDGKQFHSHTDYNTKYSGTINLQGINFFDARPDKYTVTFDENGGSDVDNQTVAHGMKATEPATTREGYTFVRWNNGEDAYDFNTVVTSDLTLTAEWTKNVLELANAGDNGDAITTAAGSGKVYEVTLTDRTLFKDGTWNTLCLPFSLSAAQIAANANFAGATLMTMDVTKKNGFDTTDGTLYLWFKTATEIEAGVPYLVKWDKATDYDNNPSAYDISNPVFEGVTVSRTEAQTVESETTGLETVQMVGTYSPVSVTADDKSILFLGDANTLYYSTVDRQIRSCRAYFSVPYINGHAEAKARAFALSFDGEETTGILEVSANYNGVTDEAWYSLDGVRLSGKPTQRGMYINKGKKILVK